MASLTGRVRRQSKDDKYNFVAVREKLKSLSDSFIESHDAGEPKIRQLVNGLQEILPDVKQDLGVLGATKVLNHFTLGGLILLATAAGLPGGAVGARLTLILGAVLGLLALMVVGGLVRVRRHMPTGLALIGIVAGGAFLAGGALLAGALVVGGALVAGAAAGALLALVVGAALVVVAGAGVTAAGAVALIIGALLAVVAAGTGIRAAAAVAGQQQEIPVYAVAEGRRAASVALTKEKLAIEAVAVVALVASMAASAAAGAVLALIVGAEMAVGAVFGLAGVLGAIVAMTGVAAIFGKKIRNTVLERGEAAVALVTELREIVEPLGEILEEIEKVMEQAGSGNGVGTGRAAIDNTKALVQITNDLMTFLNDCKTAQSFEATVTMVNAIMQLAQQGVKVNDGFIRMKQELIESQVDPLTGGRGGRQSSD